MFEQRASVLLVTALILAGCTSPIHIITPVQGDNVDPVSVKVNFLSKFDPSQSWSVSLDGQKLSGFTPTPAPGATSVVPVNFPQGWKGEHVVKTHAVCGFFCVWDSEEVHFSPPHLRWNSTTNSVASKLVQFQGQAAWAGVQYAPTVPINVTIQETTSPPKVSVGLTSNAMSPPGTPLVVTIPAGSTKGDFFLRAQSSGLFTFLLSAPGVTPEEVQGSTAPAP
jgi:hypothetical protein